MKPRSRSAFSMIELLVILAILGFLLAFLLPALQKVRAAAARTQSMNNLKQLALACHSYHDVNQKFPPGNDQNNFSATAYLLPYIEQVAVFQQLNFKVAMDAPANAEMRKLRLPLMVSPRDALPDKSDFGPTNYLFNAGSKYALKDNDGLFYQDSAVTFAQITDGLSNTLLTGETLRGDGQKKAVDVHRQHVLLTAAALNGLNENSGVAQWQAGQKIVGDRGSSWLDGRFLQGTFTGTRLYNDSRPDVSCGGAGGLSGLRGLEPIALIGFGDGSVRSITRNLNVDTWKSLAGRNDGNAVEID